MRVTFQLDFPWGDALAVRTITIRRVDSRNSGLRSPAKKSFGLTLTGSLTNLSFNDFPAEVKVVAKGTPIFPRRDVEEEVAFIKSQMSANQKAKGRKAMAEAAEKAKPQTETSELKKDIRIDVFDKVDLRVAQIKAADHVEGADKLLKFQLDDGTPEGRQILSGIAQWYPDPSVLVGKKVLIVANLKPRKMRGELSQGMILSDEDAAGNVQVVTVPENMQPGTTVC